jgi:acetyl esterase/lipase
VLSRRRFLGGAALTAAAALSLSSCASADPEEETLKGVRPIKYGDASSQIGELLLPNAFGPFPVAVLIHGGWWRQSDFDRRLMRDLARDLSNRGYATWNLEYRLVGEEGGGYPGTFEDVAAGIDKLADLSEANNLDLRRVVVIGHSAGGQLALWAGVREMLPDGAVGADPVVPVTAAVALAPVADLSAAAVAGLGEGAVVDLLGGMPDQVPFVYLLTAPQLLIPTEVPRLLVHGTADTIVPVSQSEGFVVASKDQGDPAELVVVEGADHFDVIDRNHPAWVEVVDRLGDLNAPRPQGDEDDDEDA